MENKINIARFKEGSRTAEIKGIWQWDYGQILRIQGLNLPSAVEIHFSLDEHGGEAVRRIGVTKDGVTDVPIPDSMVENESAYGDSYYFFAYIYLTDETSGNTEYKIRAKVSTRSKPEGYVNGGNDTFAEILKTVNKIAEDKVDIPESAKVGQVLSVKATDESGKPTEFEATDPGGGVSDEKIAEAVNAYLEEHPLDETDPTVPDWAKQPEKPSYTAEEVGADASGTAVAKVSEHNTASNAHNDIRLLVQGLTERLNALADSDDTTLDQMSEVVAYIKSNKSLIDAITTSKINVSDIIDNLTTNVSNKPLSAAQGVKLKALIDAITAVELDESLSDNTKAAPAGMVGELKDGLEKLQQGGGSGSDYTLPIANPNRLGGVMPVAKTETMTHPVGVDEIGRLFVESSECNEGWVKVAEIQTTEDLTSLSITEDMDGNPLSFCEAIISVIISRASDATSNGEFVMSVCPEWKNSFNNKGIYGLALLSDVYWYVGHFKKMNNLLIEQIISKKRIGYSLDLVTTWAENLPMALATGSANGMISGVKNFDKNYYGNFLNSENKFQGVTIGTDLATSVKIGSGTRLEVWVR